MKQNTVQISFEMNTTDTPTMPEAIRGTITDSPVKETREQLEANLVWCRCLFCNRMVLIDCYRRTREKCSCDAVRCHNRGQTGWRKDGEYWWFF